MTITSARMAAGIRSCAVTLLMCIVLLVCVEADYRLEVQFIRWNNPTGMCGDPLCAANEGCCDPLNPDRQGQPDRCRSGCAYHPRFCVRPLGTESNSTSDCLRRVTFTGVAENRDDFTFGTTFFGTPNPAVFTGHRWPGGIQLFMEVYDLDNGLDAELVDRFAVDTSVSVGSNITTTNTGVFGLMELTVNFRVMCVESFFVLDCITCFGVNRDPSTNCSGCLAGYGGSNCDVDLDSCGHTTPCENGATCNNTGPDQYECLCAAGFEGDSCERETNECDPNPCMNGGSCTDLLSGYNCSCPSSFSGTNCDGASNDVVTVVAGVVGGVIAGLAAIIIVVLVVVMVVRGHGHHRKNMIRSNDGKCTISGWRKRSLIMALQSSKAGTATGNVSTDNPTYAAGEIGSHVHVPPETSQINTDSTVQHEFDNPLYNARTKETTTNEYSAPWGVHPHTPKRKPPPVKAVEENKPHEYDYTVNEGATPTAVYNYADTPTTPTKPEKTQQKLSDKPTRLPPCIHACEPVYDDAIPFPRNVDGQQPTYDYAETLATQSKLEKEQLPTYDYAVNSSTNGVLPQNMYDYAESSAAHPSGSPQLVYDYAESSGAQVNTNGGFPVHEHDYAGNREPGTVPPGVREHYEMLPTENGVGSSHHYAISPN